MGHKHLPAWPDRGIYKQFTLLINMHFWAHSNCLLDFWKFYRCVPCPRESKLAREARLIHQEISEGGMLEESWATDKAEAEPGESGEHSCFALSQ